MLNTLPRNTLSRPLVSLTVTALAAGVVLGFIAAGPGTDAPDHDPPTNAIALHVVLALCLVLGGGVLTWRHGTLRWLGIPWSRRTAQRFRATLGDATGSVKSTRNFLFFLRFVGAVIVALFCGYLAVRMGMQVGFSTDPAMTVNAWGGPTAVGAFLAHAIDAALMFGLAVVVGNLLLVRAPESATAPRPAT
ncbi:MAG: hypothetical protein ACTH1D_05830 [Mycobacteriaceae bacterium]